jgi:hypothetical protein
MLMAINYLTAWVDKGSVRVGCRFRLELSTESRDLGRTV